MKSVKNLYILVCLIIGGLLMVTSCIKVEHIEDIPYAAKVDTVIPYTGNKKAYLEIFVASPQIEMLRVYWDNRHGVKETTTGGVTGKYLVTIDGLESMIYEFTVYSYDQFRHESLPTQLSVTVYDDEYHESLRGRAIQSAVYASGTLTVVWSAERVPNEQKTILTYTNADGQKIEKDIPSTAATTTIDDAVDISQEVSTVSLIFPEATSLDPYNYRTEIITTPITTE